ncbi:tetratricopeptide repeat protein [Alteromonas sp. AMM-1]|uniref:tetratricopeptide repeat protein n=1 Tax=Alteromonas sp. AMM-1 TaxID=3394233 RepID=UPI0039A5BD0B
MQYALIAFCLLLACRAAHGTEETGNELSYEHFVHSDKPIKCLYGYAAEKVGDHDAAIAIFEDCIARWESVYSMIWLAQIYDSGIGVPQDLEKAAALLKRGAHTQDEAGYTSLAKYHYGMILIEGRGVAADKQAGINWLQRAADEGVDEAREYLASMP